ncbi:MAG: histidine kinase [Bacteroidales bacterium]
MKRGTEILIHVIFWIVASVIPHIILLAYSPGMSTELIIYQSLTQVYYIIVFYFIYFFVSPKSIATSRQLTTLLITFGASVVFLFFLKLWRVAIIDTRYSLNLKDYGIYSTGHYASDILYIIFYSAFAVLMKLFVKWYDERKAAEEKQIRDNQFELELLKAQLNPHFFFNTLNNIYSLVLKKSDEAPAALMKMSEIMRYMLYESRTQKVALSKELEYLEDYLELQKLRFSDPGYIDYSVRGELAEHDVPPMMLLSFVENAFKHGKRRVTNPGIIIRVEATPRVFNFMVMNFIIEDVPLDSKGRGGIGLKNIKRRLELIYPGSHDLTIINKDGKYTVNLNIYNKK